MLFSFLNSFESVKIYYSAMLVAAPLLCAAFIAIFKNKLPKDHGREYAVNGMKSAGKMRGAGILFICSFIICALLFVPVTAEYAIYYLMIFLEMLSGYLDDRSEKPWGEYLKGMIDLVISAVTAATFVIFNPELLSMSFFGMSFTLPKIVFGIIAALVVWALINAVNCSDGIDGFCGSLSIVSLLSIAAVIYFTARSNETICLIALLVLSLIPYLWKNAEPSTMMMGDAGSRAIGVFMSIVIFRTGNMLLVIPLCFMLCLDGLLGIIKIVTIRFMKINPLKKIRTPLHDHFRKNKGWSNTQVIFRFGMIQAIISAITLAIVK